jgi:hypothetical protein
VLGLVLGLGLPGSNAEKATANGDKTWIFQFSAAFQE